MVQMAEMGNDTINELLLSDNEEDNYLGIIIMGKYKPYNIETRDKYYKYMPVYIIDLLRANKKRTFLNHMKYNRLMKRYESEYKGDDIE